VEDLDCSAAADMSDLLVSDFHQDIVASGLRLEVVFGSARMLSCLYLVHSLVE
jgi:hypothetical protein